MILDPKILAEIRKYHINARRLVDETISGQYKSAFKGQGIEFEEIREYSPGDDVRSIDWKVTAKMAKPYIKQYREERELTVIIAVDISASTFTGTKAKLRESVIADVSSMLALIALRNNDKVGLVTFSNKIESYHPPRKARSATWRILHEILTPKQHNNKTDLKTIAQFLSSVLKRKSIVFILSDFFSPNIEDSLSSLSRRHDLTAITVSDPADISLPNVGLVQLQDSESEKIITLDTSRKTVREAYANQAAKKLSHLYNVFSKHKIGHIKLNTNESYLPALRKYFISKKLT